MRILGCRVPMMASLLVWACSGRSSGRAGWSFLSRRSPTSSRRWARSCERQTFRAAAVITLRSFAIGMALAIAAGVPLGILMGRVRAADRLLACGSTSS